MTPHLGDTEFVDLLDRTLPRDRVAHVESCGECRQKADTLNVALAATADVEVPEPSPLFWEHLSTRIRAAVAAEPAPSSVWRDTRFGPALRWPALATAAVLVLVVALWRADGPSSLVSTDPHQIAPVGNGAVDYLFGDIEADEAWAIVRTVADQLEEDDIHAAGMGSRPGSAAHVANALSEAERVELASLIEHEIKTLRASVPSS